MSILGVHSRRESLQNLSTADQGRLASLSAGQDRFDFDLMVWADLALLQSPVDITCLRIGTCRCLGGGVQRLFEAGGCS